MEKSMCNKFLIDFFDNFDIKFFNDDNLKHADGYFADSNEERYIFYCIEFDNKEQLLNSWQQKQDDDIALYLQSSKYLKKDIRWDMYYLILYTGEEQIDIDKCTKIERDRFCSRKVIIDAKTKTSLYSDLNKKLPFALEEYYPSNNLCEVTNEIFYSTLRSKANLDSSIFPDDLFENIQYFKDKWIYLLGEIK